MKVLTIFFLLFLTNAQAQLIGKVISIADGDTFTMLVDQKNIRVRLHGIDCPEKSQDYEKVAKDHIASLIAGKMVEVRTKNIDRYRRQIGIVFIKGVNVNEALLKNGLAWHFKKYDKNAAWAELENKAKSQKLNIWSIASPTSPWEWRKNKAALKKLPVSN
jgi:endonuclease YncB( thermonuclease family)